MLFAADPSTASRTYQVHRSDIINVYTQFGYNTVVVFPKGEEVTGVLAPEQTFWGFNYGPNYLLIKAKGSDKQGHPGQKTSVSALSASGNIYTFLVQEVSNAPQKADLRLELEQEDADSLAAIQHPQYVRASELDSLKKQLDSETKELAHNKRDAATEEVRNIKHDYEWQTGKVSDALGLRSIYHDDKFTYIEAGTQEAATLYEKKDGKDSIVNYTLDHGVYVVPKVIDHGVLRVGKKSLEFSRNKETV